MDDNTNKGHRLKRKLRSKFYEYKYKLTSKKWWKKKLPSILASIAKGFALKRNRRDEP